MELMGKIRGKGKRREQVKGVDGDDRVEQDFMTIKDTNIRFMI